MRRPEVRLQNAGCALPHLPFPLRAAARGEGPTSGTVGPALPQRARARALATAVDAGLRAVHEPVKAAGADRVANGALTHVGGAVGIRIAGLLVAASVAVAAAAIDVGLIAVEQPVVAVGAKPVLAVAAVAVDRVFARIARTAQKALRSA